MGNLSINPSCCTDRFQGSQHLLQSTEVAGRPQHRRFEQARAEKNIATLVSLLSSDEPLPKQSRVTTHPWAKAPETLGPLVAAHIAVMVSADKTCALSSELVGIGLTEQLAHLLKSTQLDKVHAAAVTLLFLTEKSPTACTRLVDTESLQILESCSLSGTIGLQLTALSIVKNIARVNWAMLPIRTRNIAANQIVEILLMQSSRKTPKANDFLLEGLQIATDMMEIFGPLPESGYRQSLIDKGIKSILSASVVSGDRDVADEARRLQALMNL